MGNHLEKQDSADTGKTLYDIYSRAYCVLGSYPFGEVRYSPESVRCPNAVVYVLYPDDIYPYVCTVSRSFTRKARKLPPARSYILTVCRFCPDGNIRAYKRSALSCVQISGRKGNVERQRLQLCRRILHSGRIYAFMHNRRICGFNIQVPYTKGKKNVYYAVTACCRNGYLHVALCVRRNHGRYVHSQAGRRYDRYRKPSYRAFF